MANFCNIFYEKIAQKWYKTHFSRVRVQAIRKHKVMKLATPRELVQRVLLAFSTLKYSNWFESYDFMNIVIFR